MVHVIARFVDLCYFWVVIIGGGLGSGENAAEMHRRVGGYGWVGEDGLLLLLGEWCMGLRILRVCMDKIWLMGDLSFLGCNIYG